jgi:hypothetical protein
MTDKQTALFDGCAFPAHSEVIAFAATKVVVARLYTRSILWPDREQRERK